MAQDTQPNIDPASPDYAPPQSEVERGAAARRLAEIERLAREAQGKDEWIIQRRRRLDEGFNHQPVAGHGRDDEDQGR